MSEIEVHDEVWADDKLLEAKACATSLVEWWQR